MAQIWNFSYTVLSRRDETGVEAGTAVEMSTVEAYEPMKAKSVGCHLVW
jgi:hypothetical protein